jgi:hypothetical protein
MEQIETYIRQGGGGYGDWFIGMAYNPIDPITEASRLHRVQSHRFSYIETISQEVARAVAEYFINVCGTDGDIIEEERDDACRALYVYKKTKHLVACETGTSSGRFAKSAKRFLRYAPQQQKGDYMHRDHEIFIQAIKDRKKLLIKFHRDEDSDAYTEVCCPLFYIPAGDKDSYAHYYFWEGENGSKGNIMSVKTDRIVHIGPTNEPFDPVGFTLTNKEGISPED